MSNVETPTLDKIRSVSNKSQAIGEFLDWLYAQGYVLGGYQYHPNCPRHDPSPVMEMLDVIAPRRDGDEPECRCDLAFSECYGVGDCDFEDEHVEWTLFHPIMPRTTPTIRLLEEFFSIDPVAAEDERRALLEELREAQARQR